MKQEKTDHSEHFVTSAASKAEGVIKVMRTIQSQQRKYSKSQEVFKSAEDILNHKNYKVSRI